MRGKKPTSEVLLDLQTEYANAKSLHEIFTSESSSNTPSVGVSDCLGQAYENGWGVDVDYEKVSSHA